MSIEVVAKSENGKYVVSKKDHLYCLHKVGASEQSMKWQGDWVLYSALSKGGFVQCGEPIDPEDSPIEKSRRSVGRKDRKRRGEGNDERDRLIVNLGLENFKDIVKSKRMAVGFVGYSVMEFDRDTASDVVSYVLDGLPKDAVVVTGATNIGIPNMVVEMSKKRGLYTIGIMPKDGYKTGLSDVDELVIEGLHWGDESQKFIDMIDKLYAIGGGRQSTKEILMAEAKGIEVQVLELLPAEQYSETTKSGSVYIDLEKANNQHLPDGAERYTYSVPNEYGTIYIPVNRLKQVYQTDDATDQKKVNSLVAKMKSGSAIDPVQIGYNYDIHDGHHRWEAAKKLGYSHVPCKVVGADPSKVREAREMYLEVWKGLDLFIDMSLVKAIFNRGKLVKKMVPVKGKGGKVFYAHRWVDPTEKMPEGTRNPKQEEHTYKHHENDIKDMERRFSNRFPVLHHPTQDIKNRKPFYTTDKKKYDEAMHKYNKGEALPPVTVNDRSEVVDNHHLLDLAKDLKLSHVPVVVTGNPGLKKDLEASLRKVPEEDVEESGGGKVMKPITVSHDEDDGLLEEGALDLPVLKGYEHVTDIDSFKNIIVRKYPKSYIMDQASKEGIVWTKYTNDGERLADNSAILWKNAHMAISAHIQKGRPFRIKHDTKQIDARMSQDGKNPLHRYFLEVLQKFGGNREDCMEWCRQNKIHWKENYDPYINWKNCSETIQKELSQGKSINGVRVRIKGILEDGKATVTPQIQTMIQGYKNKHGRHSVMSRMEELGIDFDHADKQGNVLDANSPILWMRAAMSLGKHLAKGNEFSMGGEQEPNGIIATAGKDKDTGGIKLSRWQNFALDLAARNSQNNEEPHKKWALQAIQADRGLSGESAEQLYKQFMENARKAKIMYHFDPLHKLDNGSLLADQMSSDGEVKSAYHTVTGLDLDGNDEEQHPNGIADNYMFTPQYEPEDKERAVYGTIDMFNQGLKHNANAGEVALVMKDDIKKRSTGSHIAGEHMGYDTEGQSVRSLTDPHHLVVDRWSSRWSKPNKKDSQRIRAMDSSIKGITSLDDSKYFEAHMHGGIKLDRDVDHILAPAEWQTDKKHLKKHTKLKQLAKQFNIPIKYEGE